MTKQTIEEYLVNATEKITIDIDGDIYKNYLDLAESIGVPVEDYISAVVIKYFKELKK